MSEKYYDSSYSILLDILDKVEPPTPPTPPTPTYKFVKQNSAVTLEDGDVFVFVEGAEFGLNKAITFNEGIPPVYYDATQMTVSGETPLNKEIVGEVDLHCQWMWDATNSCFVNVYNNSKILRYILNVYELAYKGRDTFELERLNGEYKIFYFEREGSAGRLNQNFTDTENDEETSQYPSWLNVYKRVEV